MPQKLKIGFRNMEVIMSAPSTAVANYILDLANADRRSLTNMQLQKLVYIAHGWTLAITNERLTSDDPVAWDYGPVYQDLYRSLRQYGAGQVTRKIKYEDFAYFHDDPNQDVSGSFTDLQKQIMQSVWKLYGNFHAFQLSALTHQEGTPWSSAYKAGKDSIIQSDVIRRHFEGLAHQRNAKLEPSAAIA